MELVQPDLSNDHLEGAIPDELANLKQLSTLDVPENNLTGTIPRGFFSMLTLQMLNGAFNNLTGVIPNQGNGPTFVTEFHWKSLLMCGRLIWQLYKCSCELGIGG